MRCIDCHFHLTAHVIDSAAGHSQAGVVSVEQVYHVTWFVNSASHVWGNQAFNTGDQSRNNW